MQQKIKEIVERYCNQSSTKAHEKAAAEISNLLDDRCACGVPNSQHGSCCGWQNANIICFPWESTVKNMTAEEKELRWLISQSPNQLKLARFLFSTGGTQILFVSHDNSAPPAMADNEVYSREECTFNYCADPNVCKSLGRCKNAPKEPANPPHHLRINRSDKIYFIVKYPKA